MRTALLCSENYSCRSAVPTPGCLDSPSSVNRGHFLGQSRFRWAGTLSLRGGPDAASASGRRSREGSRRRAALDPRGGCLWTSCRCATRTTRRVVQATPLVAEESTELAVDVVIGRFGAIPADRRTDPLGAGAAEVDDAAEAHAVGTVEAA